MPNLRNSPSGELVDFASSTSDVENASTHVSGVTASDALDSLDTRVASLIRTRIFERFVGGTVKPNGVTSVVGVMGDLGWSAFASSTITSTGRLSGTSTRYGQYSLDTAAGNIRMGIVLGGQNTPSSGSGLLISQVDSVSWVGATNVAAGINGKYRFGLGSNGNTASMGTDGVFLESDREFFGVWRAIARRGGIETAVATSVNATNNTYYTLGFTRADNGDIDFTINGAAVATITSNFLPTALLFPECQIQATINSGQSMVVDTFTMEYRRS